MGESNGWSDRKLAKRKGHVTGLEVKKGSYIGHIRVILTPTGENYQRLGLSSPGQVHGAKEISDYKMLQLDLKTQIWNQLDVLATSWSRLDDGDEPGEIYTLTRW